MRPNQGGNLVQFVDRKTMIQNELNQIPLNQLKLAVNEGLAELKVVITEKNAGYEKEIKVIKEALEVLDREIKRREENE